MVTSQTIDFNHILSFKSNINGKIELHIVNQKEYWIQSSTRMGKNEDKINKVIFDTLLLDCRWKE